MSNAKKIAVAPVKVVARKIVAQGRLALSGIQRSKQFADEFFLVTEKKATTVHSGLTLNDQKPKFGNGGSFIVGEAFIQSLAVELGIAPSLVPSYLTPRTTQDLPSILNFDVEERFVGQVVQNEFTGADITYGGNKNASAPGEVYYFPTNFVVDVSHSAALRADAFIEKLALTVPVVEFRPRRGQNVLKVESVFTEADTNVGISNALSE
jgi:hypothetical protein